MFVYLSKKIAIPNNIRLNCVAWNKDQGYIAVGGDDGLVKVLKLDQASTTNAVATTAVTPTAGMAAPSNLSMNQTLEGHKAAVQVVTWNESMQKLTTSDREGVIMVWMLYKGAWFEEMTNDRKKSTVKGMSWTADGQKICIVYEDGAIIVGSADGSRIWGKELKNTLLTGVQWSPDGRLLLFSLRSGELHLYDNQGTFVMKLNVQCVALSPSRNLSVVGLNWFHGHGPTNRPTLAICYENGKLQIMKNENDDHAIVVDTNMMAVSCMWNPDGSILAVCGIKTEAKKESNAVQFYSAFGSHLRTLKIPGREITGLSWEGQSLRVAMAVDSFIYFANIRPDYLWCYFSRTVVYLKRNGPSHGDGATFTFWDTAQHQCYNKQVDQPLGVATSNDHCVIVVEVARVSPKDPNITVEVNFKDRNYQLLVCNSISTTVDSKYTDIRPQFVAMNSQYVTIASKDHFLLWPYHTPKNATSISAAASSKSGVHRKDKRFHIDDTSSIQPAVEVLNDLDKSSNYMPPTNTNPSTDPICCLAMSEKLLLVGRESGCVMEFSLPQVVLRHTHRLSSRAYKIAINSNSSRAAIIDTAGVLTTIDLLDGEKSNSLVSANTGRIDRKDVWAMCWASDNPQLLAIMEKTRMYVLRGVDPEEPISCSGYICNFEDLEITGVLLDEIVSGSTPPDKTDHLLHLRVKSLRDTEELLAHVGIAEAKLFIEDNPHPRLWRLLAEAALRKMDFDTAESAFVRCTNYPGIQLIKRLRQMQQNELLQRAVIAAFFGDFDEAEKLYIDADRRDLAIELRRTLCDCFRTVQLYQMGPGISDQQMEQVWREIGGHFASSRSWDSAKQYFEKSHDIEGLMDSLYHLEQYEELVKCIHKLPEKSSLLSKLGQMLSSVGMCDPSVAAFLKCGDVKAAVNTCVALKQWGQAVELAQKYKMPQIAALLEKHAAQLLQEGRLPEAIALQRKAGRFMDAARLMTKLAEGEVAKHTNSAGSNYLRIKKIFVMAGLLTEDHIKLQTAVTRETRLGVLAQMSAEDSVLVDHIWNCAKAYHFLLLAQRQLRSGLIHSAVLTALRLRDYEDILNTEEIYDLLAMASCADRSFGTCSKAFIKLEALEDIPEHRRLTYEELAVSIFSKHEPNDNRIDRVNCFTCEALVPTWCSSCPTCGCHFPPCVASGQSLMAPTEAWQCATCHHCASRMEVANRKTCPLCHAEITEQKQ